MVGLPRSFRQAFRDLCTARAVLAVNVRGSFLVCKYALPALADGETARAAVFLASDDAAFMTGATLAVDGGSASEPWHALR